MKINRANQFDGARTASVNLQILVRRRIQIIDDYLIAGWTALCNINLQSGS